MANLVDLRHKALAPDGDVEKFTKEAHEVMNEFKEESTHVQGMKEKLEFLISPFSCSSHQVDVKRAQPWNC